MKVGLVGLGRMGKAIFRRLREQGFEIVGWDVNPAAVSELSESGLQAAKSAAELAAGVDVVLSVISADNGARHNFHSERGYLKTDLRGKLFIEMSTLQPTTVRELAALAETSHARLIEAPVLGSIPTVLEGKLLVLAGGRAEDINRARSVLDHLARRIAHMGPIGSGAAMKLAVNLGMAAYIQALAEGLALGEQHGLSIDAMLEILCEAPTNSPWLRSKIEVFKGGEADMTLDLKTLRKDVMSAVAMGALKGVPMPGSAGALTSLSAAVAGDWGDKDIAQLPRYFRQFMVRQL
jgi:3-hydroxyisobutyrate dehydrogenase-like beta-hydroxyacid dehydrogenase